MTVVERLWMGARSRAGHPFGRRRPEGTATDVLLALVDGPDHGGAIARATGRTQSEVTSRILPRLDAYGFVRQLEHVPGLGNQGGGRPAVIWALTPAGALLVAALVAERAVAA